MKKLDFKKSINSYKATKNKIEIIEVPKIKYITIDGKGDPNTGAEFNQAIRMLYPIAYKIKFFSKQKLAKDYVVMPLEALWWSEDMSNFTSNRDKSKWNWTLMIMQPNWITKTIFKSVLENVKTKYETLDFSKVKFKEINESKCVQTLHIGSFDDEADILKEIHENFIPVNNLVMTKKHHEIYLSDFRRVAPEKLKTILRQPVKSKKGISI
jgi:hypothetical protein